MLRYGKRFRGAPGFGMALMMVLALLVGCAKSQPSAGGDPIKIGLTSSITGAYSEFGESMRNVVQLAVDDWNARGGVKGRQVKLVVYDDQLLPDRAQSNMRRLLEEDKVAAVIGPAGSGPALAVAPMVAAKGVVMMNTIAQTPAIVYPNGLDKPPYPNIFTFAVQNDVEAVVLAESLATNWKKIGLISESTTYGTTGLDLVEQVMKEKYGLKPVGREVYKQKDPDMTAQVARLKRAGAEVIGVIGLGSDAATLKKDMNRLDFQGRLVGSMGVFSQPFKELAGDLVVGTAGTLYNAFVDFSKARPQAKALTEAYIKKYGHDRYYGPDADPIPYFGHTASSYDAAMVLLDAMNRAKSLDAKDIIAELESGKPFPSARTDYVFSSTRHQAVSADMIGLYQYVKQGDKIGLKPFAK
jgi:branched-chain amino acid transport system substrate-binding protein